MTTKSVAGISKLPTELVTHCLTYLPQSELSNALSSCKAVQASARDSRLWSAYLNVAVTRQCPDNLTGKQHEANQAMLRSLQTANQQNKKFLATRLKPDETTKLKPGEATEVASALVRLIVEYTGEPGDKEVLRRTALTFQANKLYDVFPEQLIDLLGGYEAYLALPELTLDGTQKKRLGEKISVFNLRQTDLIDVKKGRYCAVMRGVEKHEPETTGLGEIREREDTRFISIAIDTPDSDRLFVLTFYERPKYYYSESGKKCYNEATPRLAKDAGNLPTKYMLGSGSILPGDFEIAAQILQGTHPTLTLGELPKKAID